ncbi:MAG: phosphopyruvate hydratase [Actinomycetota bacterium]|nr:phosphopyruvate hydratase [Actinomycetota bacterium]
MTGSFAIASLDACEVLDSRGRPTVWCEVVLGSGARAAASVPSGASTGRHERHELRDGGDRYDGRGVRRAVRNVVDEIAPAVLGLDARDQEQLDATMLDTDGTPALERLGANAVLSVSVAAALASAAATGTPLYRYLSELRGERPVIPMPMVNILSGGAHAARALDLQDFLVVPHAATTFSQAIEWVAAVRESAVLVAESRGHHARLAADEGGLGIALDRNEDALELLTDAIERAGHEPGATVSIAVDVAATQLVHPEGYELRLEGRTLSAAGLLDEIARWCESYPVCSVEDAFGEDDWDGWRRASVRLPGVQLVGDDLFATDVARLRRATELGVANAVLVKPNQRGTLSGALEVLDHARSRGYATILSARSGETEDSWLADLAVGWGSGQVKVGSTTRSERTAKWNRLLVIEHQLGPGAALARFARPAV